MLKIMFADPDSDSIKNFKKYIKLSFPDFRIVGSMQSPANFLREIKTAQPNLVVADIRFFGVSAYQMIRDTYELYPDVRFVLYGTYNDVEYMEKVMEFGVIDYMYRPVKPSDFERCLGRALKIFTQIEQNNKKKEQLVTDYQNKKYLFQDRFLINLLHGHLDNDNEIESSFRYFNIDLTPEYTVFIVRIDRYRKLLLTMEDMEKHLLSYRMLLIVEEKLKKLETGIATLNHFNAITAIVGKGVSLSDLIIFCDELKSDILSECRIGVTIGIGRTYARASDICISFKEAEAAIRYRHYAGYNTVIPLQFVEPYNNVTYRYPIDKEEMLVYSAVTGEYEYCETLLKQIIQSLRNCGDLPEKLLSKIVLDIIVSINRFSDEQHIPQDSPFTAFFPSKEIFEIKTLDDAYTYLSGKLKNYCEHITAIRNKIKLDILEQSKQYIDVHYFENLTLSAIANKLKTTPEFLGNIFLLEEKKSLYEYIIGIRMENAKKFMRESGADDETVSARVGYQDVRHFRSVFRQHVGMYTHEYRTANNLYK